MPIQSGRRKDLDGAGCQRRPGEAARAGRWQGQPAIPYPRHSRDGKSPFLFSGGTLTYETGPDNSRVVENTRMKIEIDPYGIKSIFDKKTGTVVAQAGQVHGAMAMLTLKKPGDSPTFSCDLYNAALEKCEVDGTRIRPC